MKDLNEIETALSDAAAGTIVMIRGYVNSAGDRGDLEVELLKPGAYMSLVAADLRKLQSSDASTLTNEDSGDLTQTDLVAAREQLITARQNSLARADSDDAPKKGPDYIVTGLSTAYHPNHRGALYIQGVRVLNSSLPGPKLAKGAIPRAKQKVAEMLDLPSRHYLHNIKLEAGKFEELHVYEQTLEG